MKFCGLLLVSGILSLLHTHLFSEEISFRDDVSENANFYGKKFSRMRSPHSVVAFSQNKSEPKKVRGLLCKLFMLEEARIMRAYGTVVLDEVDRMMLEVAEYFKLKVIWIKKTLYLVYEDGPENLPDIAPCVRRVKLLGKDVARLMQAYRYIQELDASFSECVDWDTVKRLPGGIQKINLAFSGLARVPKVLMGMKKLREVNLAGNRDIEMASLYGLGAKISSINVSYCNIIEIPEHVLASLEYLEELDLSFNKNIRWEEIEALPKTLERLSLKGCGLEKIPHAVKNLRLLKTLNLSKNFLLDRRAVKSMFPHNTCIVWDEENEEGGLLKR